MPIVVLSGRQDRDNVLKALDLGALGFIPKSTSREVMLRALELVFAGGVYLPPEVLVYEQCSEQLSNQAAADRPRLVLSELGFTERQLDVLVLITQGKNNKTICRLLNLAEPTVKSHITNILKALKVTNRTEAMIAVNKFGWNLPQITVKVPR
jgi:DNA-binding NarL/FixJ family response regulator